MKWLYTVIATANKNMSETETTVPDYMKFVHVNCFIWMKG